MSENVFSRRYLRRGMNDINVNLHWDLCFWREQGRIHPEVGSNFQRTLC